MNSAAAILLILFLPFLLAHSLPIQLETFVGQSFTFRTAEGHAVDAEMLPGWCRFNKTARLIYGIPQLKDLGHHLISIHDVHIEVEVVEEEENVCGPDQSTIWLETLDPRKLVDVPIEEQYKKIQALMIKLKDTDIKMEDVRVFPSLYLSRYRAINEFKVEQTESTLEDRLTFVLNIGCRGEITEQASDVINVIADNEMPFQVVEGELRTDRTPITTTSKTTTTTASTSTTPAQSSRTTRRVHGSNQRPIVLNPLKTYACTRGLLCRLAIDENTFMDPEDGHTSKLTLKVHAIGNHSNFLVVVPGQNMLEGVPFGEGDAFSFRLEARDRGNLANSAPFQVIVKNPTGKVTHRYSMLLDTPMERFANQPDAMRDFIYRLAAFLHNIPAERASPELLVDAAQQIQIDEIADNQSGQIWLRWSNATSSKRSCEEWQINATRDRMVHPSTERLRHDFVKAMGAQFHVRKVTLEQLGKCQTRHILDNMRIRVMTTTQKSTSVDSTREGTLLDKLLIPLILLAAILILIALLVLICCMNQWRVGKKGNHREFTTKGRPVVFPDEVPHRDDGSSADGSMATVTTPMLVEREQPPLDPAKMTMHENPLYRPPPHTQAVLKKTTNGGPLMAHQHHELSPPTGVSIGAGTSPPSAGRPLQMHGSPPPPLVSTFSPPAPMKPIDASPIPLRANPFVRDAPYQQSVRIHATPVGQRLPPPYLAH